MNARHNKLRQQSILVLVLFSFLFSIFSPAFAGNQSPLTTIEASYQRAYQAYLSSVVSGASSDEIQKNLDAYLKVYGEYLKTQSPKGPVQNPVTSSYSTGSGAALKTADQQALSATSIATGPQSLIKTTQSWLGKIFTKAKQILFGGEKNAMPLPEKILWNIGKALVPAFGVMFSAALLVSVSPLLMIFGGIAVGASLGGLLTYSYEKRMNSKYRETPKENGKIWRDVAVQAAVDAVIAPFNLATVGLFGMIGPTVGAAIGRVALTQAGLTFAGSAVSSGVGGLVKHAFATNYFHYPEKIASDEKKIDDMLDAHIAAGTTLSDAELKELDRLRADIDSMKSEDYTPADLGKDLKRAAVSAVISGFAGSVFADKAYTADSGRWADRIALKVFGTAAHGKQISALVSTVPVNFVSGVSGAALEKHFISQDILNLQSQQSQYQAGTIGHQYYDGLIRQMEAKRDSINLTNAGVDSMVNNFAIRAAQITVQGLKYNLVDAPQAKKQILDDKYRSQNPEWQKASGLYDKYQNVMKGIPNPVKFKSPVAYAKAQADYVKNLESARREWLGQCLNAQNVENQPNNQLLKQQIETQYDHDLKMNQILELGRLKGGMAHIDAMKTIIKDQNPKLQMNDQDLTKLACQAIAKSYSDKFTSCTTKVQEIEGTIKKYDDYKAGRLTLSDAEARSLEAQRDLISPSQYKAALVEKQVYELKSSNVRWDDVEKRMPEILAQSERMTLDKYGGNWGKVLIAEMYANGLAQYKYNPDGSVHFKDEMKNIAAKVPGMIESGVVNDYKTRVNNAIISSIIPANSAQQNVFERNMQSVAKTAITEGTGGIIDSVYGASKDKIIGGFSGH
ncbi:MAG: hypothetical protein HQM09_11165 [Candidatus Riflebacteria bacterium]|nr:hypothetical protein [Candidatus Riflebacteria bacterium]